MFGTNDSDFSAQPGEPSGKVAKPETASTTEPMGTETPQYVSKVDHDRELQNLERRLQGLVDRNASRMDKRVSDAMTRIDGAIEAGKAVGIQYTPEQEEAIRDRAVRQAMSAKETAQPSGQPAQRQGQAEQGGEQLDPVTLTARMLFQKHQVSLTPNDRQWSMIKTDTDDPEEYLDSVRAAIKDYEEQKAKPVSQAAAPSTAGKGSPVAKPNEDDYRDEVMAARGKPDEIRKIKAKFAKAGLDVDNVRFFPSKQ